MQIENKSKLNRIFFPFLAMSTCFSVIGMIHATFLNTYLIHATGETRNVLLFNAILAICQPASMLLAVVMIRRYSAIRSQQFGLIVLTAINVYLYLFVEKAANHLYWVSILQSLSNGFYYTTYACQYVSYTTNENRDRAAGIISLVANIFSLLVSVGSGLLFTLYNGFAGYKLLFLFAVIVSVTSFLFTLRLPAPNSVANGRMIYYGHAFQTLCKNRYARASMIVTLLDGTRAGVMVFFLNIMLYRMVENESLIAVNTFITTLASIIAFAIYARFIRKDMRYKSAKYSMLLMLMVTPFLLIKQNPITIIAYGFINAFLLPFYITPLANSYWTVLEKLPELDRCRPEAHAARENYFALGRVLGIVITALFPTTFTGSVMVLFSLIALQFIGLFFARKIMNDLDHHTDN
jgi:YQGE family putative transporter